jgi:hypothetical protein
MKCTSINSHLAACDSNLPTLGQIKKATGSETAQAYIEMWIINLLNFVNVGKTMNDDQVFETAMMILAEYPFLNIADINLVFKMAKLGKMGQFYDRLDGQVILSWFETYLSQRSAASAERSINESLQYKGSNVPTLDKIIELGMRKKF